MARHNREGSGVDQLGHHYRISYQPDWLRHVKVSRDLETGRQSTKTLFRNPARRGEAKPGGRVRTLISSQDQNLAFEVAVSDPRHHVHRIRVACMVRGGEAGVEEEIEFTLEGGLEGP